MVDDQNQPTELPPHPLVVDEVTRLCRYATQADIDSMEATCKAFDQFVRIARQMVERADDLKERLAGTP